MAKKEKEPMKIISRTARCVLDGGDVRMEMGEHTAQKQEPGPTLADIADEAFRACRASLAKLMVPKYRIIVIEGEREEAYGCPDGSSWWTEPRPTTRPRRGRRKRRSTSAGWR